MTRLSQHSALGYAALLSAFSALPLTAAEGTGRLTLNATVQSSIGLVFKNNPNVGNPGFCPLSNPNTNTVGLDLGLASYTTGDSLSCVTFLSAVGFYQVSSAFDVLVSAANTASPGYQLAASLSSAPPANVVWLINLTVLTTAFTTFQNGNTYGQPVTETLRVVVNQSVPAQTLIETIFFLVTAT